MRPDGSSRPTLAGPDAGPAAPLFPIRLNGEVVKGFGRGSKELGIPTANIPISGLSVGGHEDVESGVYFGWAGLNVNEKGEILKPGNDGEGKEKVKGLVYPMVMSIGWNPFYKNTVRSVEVHILHKFLQDFYTAHLNLLILGFIRPEYDYVSRDALIEDINTDCQVARNSLSREAYERLRGEAYLLEFGVEEGHAGLVANEV
ncbi:riboflavin kinase [Bachmanniomyces sp. S44760]|nr:riboflavin kinase [Bachmanniomyces sp. S44760]